MPSTFLDAFATKAAVATTSSPASALERPEQFFDRADYGQLRPGIDRMAADPAWVANCGFRALAKGRPVCIPGILNRLGIHVPRFLPVSLVGGFMRRVMRPHR